MIGEPEGTDTDQPPEGVLELVETANDRFKRSFGSWFWSSMVIAAGVHFAVLGFWPSLQASDFTITMEEITAIDLPPELDIPPPPEAIQRPANPVVTDAQLDDEITIAPTTFPDNPLDDLPPPPTQTAVDVSDQPRFTAFEVAPEVRNVNQVRQALQREYPSLLRDAGVGGTVEMWFYINEEGVVERFQVNQSSGHTQLDEAALRVANVFEFTPALNREERVAVWVSLGITFEAVR